MGSPNNFILHMARTKIANFLFVMGFVVSLCAYSLWQPLGERFGMEDGGAQLFYAGIAAAFMFYGLAYFVVKYQKWRWVPMLVWTVAFSRVMFEIFSPKDAQSYYFWEYFFFVVSVLMVFAYWVRYRWKKYVNG